MIGILHKHACVLNSHRLVILILVAVLLLVLLLSFFFKLVTSLVSGLLPRLVLRRAERVLERHPGLIDILAARLPATL